MVEPFMKQVLCEEEDGPPVAMTFNRQEGPLDRWFDQKQNRTVYAHEVGSRILREYWICEKCLSIRWFDVLIDKKSGDLPPEERDAWKKRLHL